MAFPRFPEFCNPGVCLGASELASGRGVPVCPRCSDDGDVIPFSGVVRRRVARETLGVKLEIAAASADLPRYRSFAVDPRFRGTRDGR